MPRPPFILLLVTLALTATSIASADPPPPNLVLFAGQSNCVGVGTTAQDLDAYPHLKGDADGRMPHVVIWKPSPTLGWHPLRNGYNNNLGNAENTKPSQWGGEAQLTYELAQDPRYPHPIRIVKNAVSGTSIEQWLDPQKDNLLGKAMRGFKGAFADVKATQPYARPVFIWHQGYSNAEPATVAQYADNLRTLIQRMRDELPCPDLDIIIVRGNDNWTRRGLTRVGQLQIQQALVAESDPHVTLMGNPYDNGKDGIHLQPASYVALGSDLKRVIDGTYPFAPPRAGPSQSLTIADDTPRDTPLLTLTADDLGTPAARWALTGDGAAAFTVHPFTGDVTLIDDAYLDHQRTPTVTLTATLHNGRPPSSKEILITVTAPHGPPTPAFSLDPADAAHRTLDGDRVRAIGVAVSQPGQAAQPNADRSPTLITDAGREWLHFTGRQSLVGPATTTLIPPDQTRFTLVGVCRPAVDGKAVGDICGILTRSLGPGWAVLYDYDHQRFGVRTVVASNNTKRSSFTVEQFPPGQPYAFALVKEHDQAVLYIDGQIQTFATDTPGKGDSTPTELPAVTGNVRPLILTPDESASQLILGGAAITHGSFTGDLGPIHLYNGLVHRRHLLTLMRSFHP